MCKYPGSVDNGGAEGRPQASLGPSQAVEMPPGLEVEVKPGLSLDDRVRVGLGMAVEVLLGLEVGGGVWASADLRRFRFLCERLTAGS